MEKPTKPTPDEHRVIPLERKRKAPNSAAPAMPSGGVTLAEIAGLGEDGAPLVVWKDSGGEARRPALTQVPVTPEEIGRRCTLAFVEGDPQQPLILGLLRDNHPPTPHGYHILRGEKSLILKCGAARIELHEDGRIIVQGLEIEQQAYGSYRIRGASIKVN